MGDLRTPAGPVARSLPRGDAGDPLVVSVDGPALLRTIVVCLVLAEALLVYFDIIVTYYEAIGHEAVQDLCNLVIEGSLGGWFASVQTLVIGLIALLIVVRVRSEDGAGRRSLGFGIVAFFFLYMAADDGASLHEAVATAFEDAQLAAGNAGLLSRLVHVFPSYPWQMLFLPFLGLLGAFTAWFSFRELPSRTSRFLVVAGLACFVVAVGLDFVEGMETPYERWTAVLALHEDTIPHFSGVLEELIEMIGTTLLLRAYLGHLLDLCMNIRLNVKTRS